MVKCSECIYYDGFCYGEKDRQGYTLQKTVMNPDEHIMCDRYMGWRGFLRVLFLERRGERLKRKRK